MEPEEIIEPTEEMLDETLPEDTDMDSEEEAPVIPGEEQELPTE